MLIMVALMLTVNLMLLSVNSSVWFINGGSTDFDNASVGVDNLTNLFINDLIHYLESFDCLLFRDSDILLFERDRSEAERREKRTR